MSPLRMTWKASPRYNAEQDAHFDSIRVPHRFWKSDVVISPVRISVTRRRSPTGFEQSPALFIWTVGVLTLGDSGELGPVVKAVASGRTGEWISGQR